MSQNISYPEQCQTLSMPFQCQATSLNVICDSVSNNYRNRKVFLCHCLFLEDTIKFTVCKKYRIIHTDNTVAVPLNSLFLESEYKYLFAFCFLSVLKGRVEAEKTVVCEHAQPRFCKII